MLATRLFDYIIHQFDEGIVANCVGKYHDGRWEFYSTADVIHWSRKLASGLLDLGIQKGDKVGIVIYKNRPEWVIADLAIQYIGAIGVPMYATISAREYAYIMNEAEIKLCFIGSGDLYDKVNECIKDVAALHTIIAFDEQSKAKHWKSICSDTQLERVEVISQTIKGEDLATIIYTSGTTGNPKGVMLSHDNIISIVESCSTLLPVVKGDRVLSFLPLCHIFERAVLYIYFYLSAEIYFTGTDNLGGESGDLANVKPMFFATVPRLLEKVYEKIYSKGLALTGIKRIIFFWALSLTDGFEHRQKSSFFQALRLKIADKLVFSKWRAALGGNIKSIATGAAACPAKIARVFSAAGITITEGYGLTETSPVLTLNIYNGPNKIGTVGTVLDIVDLRILEDNQSYASGEGEIVAAGPNIMMGYYKQPEATAEVFMDIEGKRFFKTGDVGKFVKDNNGDKYLVITDRKKELFKTSGGKYVAPSPIEIALKESFLIDQAMLIGDNQKFVTAILVASEEGIRNYCKDHNITFTTLGQMLDNPDINSGVQTIVDQVNQNFSHIEQIKKWAFSPSPWEPIKSDGSEGELTPTMKIKRRVIMSKYKAIIDNLYQES